MEAKLDYSRIATNPFHTFIQPVFNFYMKDLVDGTVCWRDNPETSILIWSEDGTSQTIQTKEFSEDHNGFIAWWNQPTDDDPQVPESYILWGNMITAFMRFYFEIGIGNCDEYVCGNKVMTGEYYPYAVFLPEASTIPSFYYTGYNTGNTLDPTFPAYYHYATIGCKDPESCCIPQETLYLISSSDFNLPCSELLQSTELIKSGDMWIGSNSGIHFQLNKCSSHPENLVLRLSCGGPEATSLPTYPCLVDRYCINCDPIMGGIIILGTSGGSSLGSCGCSTDSNNLYFYPSIYDHKIVECNCQTPIDRSLYLSFTNISSPCPLTEDLIIELKLIATGTSELDQFDLGSLSSHIWSNRDNPLVINDVIYKFYLESFYGWHFVSGPDFVGFNYRHQEYWRFIATLSGHFPECTRSFNFCFCNNREQIFNDACGEINPTCDPFQLIYNVIMKDGGSLYSYGCELCNNFTVTITE